MLPDIFSCAGLFDDAALAFAVAAIIVALGLAVKLSGFYAHFELNDD